MADINEMLKESYETLNELQLKLGELNQVHDDIVSLKEEAIKGNNFSATIPKEFEKKFDEVRTLSQKYLTDINAATNKYFEVNNKVYLDNQSLFVSNINELQSKNTKFQSQVDALKTQIERLEKIDLEKHFDKLQKTLAEIFGALSTINLSLTSITQNLNNVHNCLGDIQGSIRELNQTSLQNFKILDEQSKRNVEWFDEIIKQNNIIQKEVKTNRVIQLVSIILLVVVMIILLVKTK